MSNTSKDFNPNILVDEDGEEYDFSLKPTIADDYVAVAGEELKEGEVDSIILSEEVVEALKTVEDPEIMINIYDMGLVYDIDIKENGNVFINMTLTAPNCPVAGILPQQAADAVAENPAAGRVEVRIVWEPQWTPDLMSDDGKMMIEIF